MRTPEFQSLRAYVIIGTPWTIEALVFISGTGLAYPPDGDKKHTISAGDNGTNTYVVF